MKIILATLNSKYIHMSLAPWYLKKGLEVYGHKNLESMVFEATINQSIDEIYDALIQFQADVICFSVYIWNKDQTFNICKKLKTLNPSIKIIVGGPEVSFQSSNIIRLSFIDYVMKGEGEESVSALINCLYLNKPLTTISGLVYLENDQIIENQIVPLKYYLDPYTEKFLEHVKGRIVYLETSRGCPYQCAFCLSGIQDPLRFFELEDAKEKIIKLSHSSTKTIKFVDRTFNANPKRANDILSWIIDNPSGRVNTEVCFHFEIAGDILTEELFETISRAKKGLVQFEIGLQSFNEAALAASHRKTDTQHLIKSIKRLIALDVAHIHIDLIAGLPLEGLESFKESFNQAFDLRAHMLQLGFLKLIHGSYLREHYTDYDYCFSKEVPYTIISNKWLSVEELKIIELVEHSFDRIYNSGRFITTLDYLLMTTNQKCFDLMLEIALNLQGDIKHLDSFTDALFNYFSIKTDPLKLREALVIDRLSSNASGRLSSSLKIESKYLKRYRLALAKIHPEQKGLKRAVEILLSTQQLIYVDYHEEKSLFNRFPYHLIELNTLDITNV